MFARLRTGWILAQESFAVLKADKKLLVFPLLSGLACLLVILSFLLPLVLSPELRGMFANDQAVKDHALLIGVLTFAFYFINYFVIVYFNSALVACAIIRFNGGEPTLGDGLRAASSRLPQILGWALVSATVGFILHLIENNSEKAGRFIAGILGTAWSALTFFVVPVLVVEKVGPIQGVKRSFAIVKKTWGEDLAANFSVSLIIILVSLAAALPAILGIAIGGQAAIAGIIVSVALWVVIGLVSAAVHVILTAVLYQFAVEHQVPAQFDERTLRSAFVSK